MSRPPVLVTGCFRSGTTWVGRTLCRSRDLSWVAEPFHIRHRAGVFAAPTPQLYTYVCEDNEDRYADDLAATIDGRYAWGPALRGLSRPVDVGIVAKDVGRFASRRIGRQRALLKDPIALFSAPWIHRRFGADVIVMVRHPAAIMHSQQRLGWRFNFDHLLRQPLLMRDLLGPWEDELRALAAIPEPDLVEETALVWRIMYGTVDRWRAEQPDWAFVRHEDLSRDPVSGFRQLCQVIDVDYDDRIDDYIAETTGSSNPAAAPEGQAHALHRDSKANIGGWATSLEEADVERLHELTAEIADRWYGPDDW